MNWVTVRYRLLLNLASSALILGTSVAAWAAPYVPPAGLGAPGRRESAGTRGCGFGNPPHLIALTPEENIGLTATAQPRFYWYMPVNQAQFVQFTLTQVDEAGEAELIFSTQFDVTGESGIISLPVPEGDRMPVLEAGERYRWEVAAYCNPLSEDGDLQISGWVQYQPPTQGLTSVLAVVSDSDKVALYAGNGYWYDAVDQQAVLNAATPDDESLQARWAELLQSVSLDEVIGQPLVEP